MRLSVHDLITINKAANEEEAFTNTITLAKHLDHWGYHRHWMAEHHSMDHHLSSAPEITAAYLAAKTEQIRVGTGGTMIMHYAPYKLAETFNTLASLAPGRVDLGLGRAAGGGNYAITALAEGRQVKTSDQYERIEKILALLEGEAKEDPILSRVKVTPNPETKALPWLLGATGNSAKKAGDFGLGYSFAKFFGVKNDPGVFEAYRNAFQPSSFFTEPYIISSYQIIAADSLEEANYLAKPIEVQRVNQVGSGPNPLLTPEEAKDYQFTPAEENILEEAYENRFLIKGNPESIEKIMTDEEERFGFNELMIYSPIFPFEKRLRSYEILKEIFL